MIRLTSLSYSGSPTRPRISGSGTFDITVTVDVSGTGNHYVGGFFDFEIDQTVNTYFNENGAAHGTPASGVSWEIDEPGYVFGDIYDNFLDGSLDNGNSVSAGLEDDVSFALAADFSLGAGETALVTFLVSSAAPGSGFCLEHHDPDSSVSIYGSIGMEIDGGVTQAIPLPSAAWAGLGLLGVLGAVRRRRRRAHRIN
jgi:hypothetical protein